MECITGLMGADMKDIGKTVNNMEKESTFSLMESQKLVSGKMGRESDGLIKSIQVELAHQRMKTMTDLCFENERFSSCIMYILNI